MNSCGGARDLGCASGPHRRKEVPQPFPVPPALGRCHITGCRLPDALWPTALGCLKIQGRPQILLNHDITKGKVVLPLSMLFALDIHEVHQPLWDTNCSPCVSTDGVKWLTGSLGWNPVARISALSLKGSLAGVDDGGWVGGTAAVQKLHQ